jgi:hypothetical protein
VPDFTLTVLWLTSLAMPCLLFAAGNGFRNAWITSARALAAILAGWAIVFAYADAAQALTATRPEDVHGAALAFASVFGWVVPAAIVAVTWGVAMIAKRRAWRTDGR